MHLLAGTLSVGSLTTEPRSLVRSYSLLHLLDIFSRSNMAQSLCAVCSSIDRVLFSSAFDNVGYMQGPELLHQSINWIRRSAGAGCPLCTCLIASAQTDWLLDSYFMSVELDKPRYSYKIITKHGSRGNQYHSSPAAATKTHVLASPSSPPSNVQTDSHGAFSS